MAKGNRRRSPSATRPAFVDSTGYLLSQAGRKARGAWTGVLQDLGLTPTSHAVLLVLRERGPLSLTDLATAIDADPRNLGPVLDSLGPLIERGQDPADRRRRTVGLTDRGRALAGQLAEATKAIEQTLLAPLNDDERHTLHELLSRLT